MEHGLPPDPPCARTPIPNLHTVYALPTTALVMPCDLGMGFVPGNFVDETSFAYEGPATPVYTDDDKDPFRDTLVTVPYSPAPRGGALIPLPEGDLLDAMVWTDADLAEMLRDMGPPQSGASSCTPLLTSVPTSTDIGMPDPGARVEQGPGAVCVLRHAQSLERGLRWSRDGVANTVGCPA